MDPYCSLPLSTPEEWEVTILKLRSTHEDPGMNVGHWVYLVIAALVLLIVVAALFGPLTTALTSYSTNETTFGPIIKTVVPILIGVGILLVFVYAFLPSKVGAGKQ